MFKNRKLEVRLVKDDARANDDTVTEELPTLTPVEYAALAEVAATRLGKKLVLGAIVTIAATALIAVAANALDTALQNTITGE